MFTGSSPTTRENSTASAGPRPSAYDVVRYVVAAVLVAAAVLKAHQAATDPAARAGLRGDGPLWFQIALVQLELFVAAWLLSHLYPAAARWATITLFAAFAAVSLYRLIAGRADCGCFGAAPVPPYVTFGLDMAILGALWRCPENQHSRCVLLLEGVARRSRLGPVLASAITCSAPAVGLLMAFRATGSTTEPPLVLLNPQSWSGRPFPLLNQIKPSASNLASGRWMVILVNRHCQTCREYVARRNFTNDRRLGEGAGQTAQVAVIDLAPDSSGDPDILLVGVPKLALQQGIQYLVEGPVEVSIVDGMVEGVHTPR